MSYSLSMSVAPGGDVAAAVDAAFDAHDGAARTSAGPHAAIARDHAVSIAAAVRRPVDGLTLSISGHHNKDCEPTPGWASCFMSVSATQVYPPA